MCSNLLCSDRKLIKILCHQSEIFSSVFVGQFLFELTIHLQDTVSFKLKLHNHSIFRNLFFFFLFWATPEAYGGSQARDPIRATAAGLYHNHSNGHIWVTSLTYVVHSNAGSLTCWVRPGIEPQPHGSWSDSFLLCHDGNFTFSEILLFSLFRLPVYLFSLLETTFLLAFGAFFHSLII